MYLMADSPLYYKAPSLCTDPVTLNYAVHLELETEDTQKVKWSLEYTIILTSKTL